MTLLDSFYDESVYERVIRGTEMNENDRSEFILSIDKLHSTDLGIKRIKMNLCLDVDDVVSWCRRKISEADSIIIRKGKNWYIDIDDCEITVNAYSYTIITAHKL
jgi:hypothetical protein